MRRSAPIEWFSKDATVKRAIKRTILNCKHRITKSFVALPAGGALGRRLRKTRPASRRRGSSRRIYKIEQGASLAAVPLRARTFGFFLAHGRRAALVDRHELVSLVAVDRRVHVPFSEATSIDGSTLANGPSEIDALTDEPRPRSRALA